MELSIHNLGELDACEYCGTVYLSRKLDIKYPKNYGIKKVWACINCDKQNEELKEDY